MASAIDVTVRLPFSGDRTLRVNLEATVTELIQRVTRLVPDVQRQGSTQCIMYRGRVLNEERTFAELEIPNNAVLQIMPQPRRVFRQFRAADSNMYDPPWERQEDLEHEHEHIHEHVHTNVLISHVGFNNRRAQFSDIREMLVSLFQALGFSTNAINNTAGIAAALLISYDSGVESEQPSRPVLEAAWSVVQTLQQQMAASETNSGSNRSQAQATGTTDLNPSSTLSTPTPISQTRTNLLSTASRSTTTPTPSPPHPGTSTAPGRSSTDHQLSSSAPTRDGHEAVGSSIPISILPAYPPPHDRTISNRLAGARAADRLVPALGELLSNLVQRFRDAPSFTNVIEGERRQDMSRLTELTGATAGAMTAVATLMSSILPGEDDEEDEMSRPSNPRNSRSSDRRRQFRAQSASAGGPTQSTSNQERGRSVGNPLQTQTGTGPTRNATTEPGSSQRSGDRSRTGASRNRTNRHGNAPWLRVSQGRSDDGEGEGNFETYQEMNAGFLVRFIGYYYYSLAGADSTDDNCPDDNNGTAVDVLRESFGSDGCEEPLNPFLRVLYYIMDMLTPVDFHRVCRGDFSPLADCRYEIWEIIKEGLSEVADDFIAPDDFEDYFVYFICEKLHMFVHIFDAHNRDNEGNLGDDDDDDEDDVCRHTMHFVHRMTLRLLDILTGDMEDEEFAPKLQEWFSDSFAGVVHSLGEQRGQEWDSVILAFRQACNEVGVAVLGGQCSIIFPLILNLFLGRARAAYGRINSESDGRRAMNGITGDDDHQQDNDAGQDDFDHSNCGPECPSRQAQEEDDFDHSRCGPECPGRQVQESQANQQSTGTNSFENPGDSDEDLPDLVSDSDDSTGAQEETAARLRDLASRRSPNNSTHEGVASGTLRDPMELDQNVELDDQDFDDIAAELSRELGSSAAKAMGTADDSDAEFKELAMELEEEAAAGPSSRIPHTNERDHHRNVPKEKLSTNARVSSTAVPATSLRRGPHVGLSMPTGRSTLVGSSAIGHPSFSSTAVPVTRRSTSYSEASVPHSTDEFDVLGRGAAKRWRSVVQNDENRMSATMHCPLSRGYHYNVEPQRPLNDSTAVKIVEEGLDAASKEIPVTASERRELQTILKESSAECLEFIESEIQSRIIDEDDFDNNAYPSATSRFLGWADMPE